ncbi:hypothetical protein L1856_09545 [Streptomyces sp. Tue 6430]|nr:hypothetical protein [Streptomyces sp. Tue 6430]
MPHPAVLRTLVAEYEAATATGSAAVGTRAQDLAYRVPCKKPRRSRRG